MKTSRLMKYFLCFALFTLFALLGTIFSPSPLCAAEPLRVAVAANFLLDSESRLRAALAGWSAPAAGHESAAGTTTGDHAGHRP